MSYEEMEYWFRWMQILLVFTTIWIIADLLHHWYIYYKKKQFWNYYEPDPESLTCYRCASRDTCPFVDDAYNTNGDCLATK